MFSKQQGFTLVELAIVLMIIGLLIGGILRGQELMENARVTSTLQQVTSYQGAKHTFQDSYAMLPGDMATATARLPGCTTTNGCTNGNGDGIVGILVPGNDGNEPWESITNVVASENTQFWKHMALVHLISGVSPNATTPDWGSSHPVAKIGGGFFMRYSNYLGFAGRSDTSAHYAVLRNGISGNWTCGSNSASCSVTPKNASHMDRKADDGIAITGDIIAVSANWDKGCGILDAGVNGPNGYADSLENKACDIMFKIP